MIPDLYDRKLGFGELLAASWRVFKGNIKFLLLFCIAANGLLAIAEWMVSFSLPDSLDYRLVESWSQLVGGLFDYIPALGAIVITARYLEARPISSSDVFNELRRMLGAGLHVNLYLSIVGLAHLFLIYSTSKSIFGLVAPFIQTFSLILFAIVSIYISFALQALVLRNRRGRGTLIYSWRTVKGQWGTVFGKMFLLGIVVGLPLVVILVFGMRFSIVFSSVMKQICTLIFPVFSTIFLTVLFLNIDREGLKEKVEELTHPANPVNPV